MNSRLKTVSKNVNKQLLSNEKNITIDAKHNEMISHFKNLQNSLPSLKEELKKLISEYNNKDPTKKNDLEYIVYRDNLKDNINKIKSKINSIVNNDDLNNYYLEVGTLLHGYYENIENSKTDNTPNISENFEENLLSTEENIINNNIENKNYNSVLNFFNNRTDNIEDIQNKNENVYTSMKISDFVKEEAKFQKKNILEEYLQKIDPNYISRIKIDVNICNCPKCDIEMVVYTSDGLQICESCGFQQNILIESDKPSFKDPPLEVCYFTYKRVNHLNEFCPINDKKLLNEWIKNNTLINYFIKYLFRTLIY
jgi:hypothetical protein